MKTPISNVFLIQQEDTEVPSTTAIITLDGQRSEVSSPSRINENGNKLLTKERLFPFIIADAVTKAELLWAMKTVVSHRYPQFVQLSRLVARASGLFSLDENLEMSGCISCCKQLTVTTRKSVMDLCIFWFLIIE